MILQRFMAAVLCLGIPFFSIGQDPNKLVIPSSPAFSILDYEPTAVMRPATTKDLAADVLSSFDENGRILMNLGLEFAPYWLKSHPELDRDKYLRPDAWQSIKQSFSVSAATVKDSVTNNNKLGVGFRFRILNGQPVDSLTILEQEHVRQQTVSTFLAAQRALAGSAVTTRQQAVDAVKKQMQDSKNYSDDEIAKMEQHGSEIMGKYSDDQAGIRGFMEEMITIVDSENTELAERLSDMQEDRKGLILEFAGAGGFRTNEEKETQRIGLWINASHYVSPDDIFTLTARYMNSNGDTSQNNFDLGVGFLKKAEEFNISLEGMLRWYRAEIPDVNQNNQPITRLDKSFTYRLALQGSYAFSKSVSINLSLGKEFDSPFINRTGFFSILGANFNIFKPRELTPPVEK